MLCGLIVATGFEKMPKVKKSPNLVTLVLSQVAPSIRSLTSKILECLNWGNHSSSIEYKAASVMYWPIDVGALRFVYSGIFAMQKRFWGQISMQFFVHKCDRSGLISDYLTLHLIWVFMTNRSFKISYFCCNLKHFKSI